MKTYPLVTLMIFFIVLLIQAYCSDNPEKFLKVFPIGKVEKNGDDTVITIFENYSDALNGLQDFSHVVVLYWFHKNDTPEKREILQVHPRGNSENPLTGVFACRAPVRPNLIALTVCKIVSIEGCTIHIDKIDAFDQSPVIDLKPYIPRIDNPQKEVRLPKWLKE